MSGNLKEKVISSLMWKFLERGGTQIVQFLIQIILARLLSPKDYGVVALTSVFITVSTVFVQSGLSTALIQKKEVDEEDYSSVFYVSILVSTIFYIVLFVFAPYIANFYKVNELKNVLRIFGIVLFIGAFNSIQQSIIEKKMEFKKLFSSSFGAVLVSGIFGVCLAYKGYGIWALVFQQLINQFLVAIFMFINIKWKPRFIFSLKKVKILFSFGWKLLLSSLIDTLYRELTNLIVGKKYSPSMLGYYNRGMQFPQVIVGNFNGAIQSVLFPTLSLLQREREQLKQVMRRGIITSSYIIFPCMLGLAVVSEPLIKIVLTDKWLPCVPYLRIFCFSYALWPIHTANLQAINALGRSDIFLKLEIIKKIIGLIIIFITYRYSPYAMAVGVLINGIVSSFINSYPNKKLLNYNYFQQIKDIYPSFVVSLIMAIGIYSIQLLDFSAIIILILQVFVGIIIYILISYLFKVESFMYLLEILRKFKKRV